MAPRCSHIGKLSLSDSLVQVADLSREEAEVRRIVQEEPVRVWEALYSFAPSPAGSTSSNTDHNATGGPYHTNKKRRVGGNPIPRPSNPFFVFRSVFCSLLKEVPHLKQDHESQSVSQMAARVWKSLAEDEKIVFRQRSAELKREHKEMYPDYKYTPASHGSRKRSKVKADGCPGKKVEFVDDAPSQGEGDATDAVADAYSSLPNTLATFTPTSPPTFNSAASAALSERDRDASLRSHDALFDNLLSVSPATQTAGFRETCQLEDRPIYSSSPDMHRQLNDQKLYRAMFDSMLAMQFFSSTQDSLSMPGLYSFVPPFLPQELDPYGSNSTLPPSLHTPNLYPDGLPSTQSFVELPASGPILPSDADVLSGLDMSWLLGSESMSESALLDDLLDTPAHVDVSFWSGGMAPF